MTAMKRSVPALIYRVLEITVTIVTYVVLAFILYRVVRWLIDWD